MRVARLILRAQALYFFITAVWPILDRESFESVTGEKCDYWLVVTVSSVLIPLSLCLFSLSFHNVFYPALILGAGSALALLIIDIYYYLMDEIGAAYLLDALAELIIIGGWLLAWYRFNQRKEAYA